MGMEDQIKDQRSIIVTLIQFRSHHYKQLVLLTAPWNANCNIRKNHALKYHCILSSPRHATQYFTEFRKFTFSILSFKKSIPSVSHRPHELSALHHLPLQYIAVPNTVPTFTIPQGRSTPSFVLGPPRSRSSTRAARAPDTDESPGVRQVGLLQLSESTVVYGTVGSVFIYIFIIIFSVRHTPFIDFSFNLQDLSRACAPNSPGEI